VRSVTVAFVVTLAELGPVPVTRGIASGDPLPTSCLNDSLSLSFRYREVFLNRLTYVILPRRHVSHRSIVHCLKIVPDFRDPKGLTRRKSDQIAHRLESPSESLPGTPTDFRGHRLAAVTISRGVAGEGFRYDPLAEFD
jgi:hypothetical protein